MDDNGDVEWTDAIRALATGSPSHAATKIRDDGFPPDAAREAFAQALMTAYAPKPPSPHVRHLANARRFHDAQISNGIHHAVAFRKTAQRFKLKDSVLANLVAGHRSDVNAVLAKEANR